MSNAFHLSRQSNKQEKRKVRRTENEVILRDLAVADLLRERISSGVDVDPKTERGELALDLDGVVVLGVHKNVRTEQSREGKIVSGNVRGSSR